MLKRRREQRTHELEFLRVVQVPIWYRKITTSPTSPTSTRIKLEEKASLIERTSRRNLPTSRRILIRRRECAMFAVVKSIGPPAALISTRSADLKLEARPPMLS